MEFNSRYNFPAFDASITREERYKLAAFDSVLGDPFTLVRATDYRSESDEWQAFGTGGTRRFALVRKPRGIVSVCGTLAQFEEFGLDGDVLFLEMLFGKGVGAPVIAWSAVCGAINQEVIASTPEGEVRGMLCAIETDPHMLVIQMASQGSGRSERRIRIRHRKLIGFRCL